MVHELKWGETHWDNMTHSELLEEVLRMYAVIVAQNGIIQQHKTFSLMTQPAARYFWEGDGIGARAVEMARQVLEPISERYGNDDPMYSGFYRYALDLLFEQDNVKIGHKWAVCPVCGITLGAATGSSTNTLVGTKCADNLGKPDCEGILRLLQWSDLRPK